MINLFILLAGDPKSGGGTIQLLFLGLMILVLWMFMIRPQAKKAKQQKTFIDNLQKGDKVVTIAGIHGVVNKVNEDNTLSLEINPGSYIKIERSSISMDWTAQLNKVAEVKK
ncbi:MAG: preprotein translocase subunit YajC [Chitinophagaceae bacterium]|jgi:preprotein translocase subunit YajC|nr:preprotein translocase subunit YajC [Chitinophagaceae bacterium]